MSNELTLVVAVIGLIVSIMTIVTFVLTRKEKGKAEGVEQGEILNSLKYIEQSQTNVLIGQKEMTAKLDKINEEVIVLKVKENILEERESALEERVDKLEKHSRGL